jgi:hypothetical protein
VSQFLNTTAAASGAHGDMLIEVDTGENDLGDRVHFTCRCHQATSIIK